MEKRVRFDSHRELASANLHVYGDMLKFYGMIVRGELTDIEDLILTIKALITRLFSLYVACILSKAGYFRILPRMAEDDPWETLDTTKWVESEWLENMDRFEIVEEGFHSDWMMYFENDEAPNFHQNLWTEYF